MYVKLVFYKNYTEMHGQQNIKFVTIHQTLKREIICKNNFKHRTGHQYTGLFISPSGISELDCATTKTDTAEKSISIGRESLQVFVY